MPATPEAVFHYEVEKSGDDTTGPITTILCHGRVVSQTSGQIKEVVKPLIPLGGRIVLDLTDVSYVDSSGQTVGLTPGRTWVELVLNTTYAASGAFTITP